MKFPTPSDIAMNAKRYTRRGDRYSFTQINSSDLITIDPDILGGTAVFKGTRVLGSSLGIPGRS